VSHDAKAELEALLDAGRRAVVAVPGGARGRLEERLGALAGMTASAGAGAAAGHGSSAATGALQAAKAATVAKAALLFVAGAGVGLVTKDHVWPPAPTVEVRYVDRTVEVARPVPSSAPVVSPEQLPSAPLPTVVKAAPAHPSADTSANGTDERLARERTMIETARSALVRGDASGALAVLSQHSSTFPRGQLAETREALAIQALSNLGRSAEARSRAERFRRDYPSSVYQGVVDEATRTISP
jgi:hypothetical protein